MQNERYDPVLIRKLYYYIACIWGPISFIYKYILSQIRTHYLYICLYVYAVVKLMFMLNNLLYRFLNYLQHSPTVRLVRLSLWYLVLARQIVVIQFLKKNNKILHYLISMLCDLCKESQKKSILFVRKLFFHIARVNQFIDFTHYYTLK